MSIDRLRYFAAVVETKNLRKAAELVGISPPSMSKAISTLESELSCKLIFPEGRGIGITEKGLEVYRQSTSLLEEYQRFFIVIRENKQKSERLRVATFEVFSSYFISAFLEVESKLDVLLLEKGPGKIEEAILNGTVDIGITYLPCPDPRVEYLEIGSFKMGIFGKKKWEKIDFNNLPFAVPTTELRIHSLEIDTLDMWPNDAPRRYPKYNFELLETALLTASSGLAVLHCPDFIVHLHNLRVKESFQLQQLSTPRGYKQSKPIKVYLVKRKGMVIPGLEGKLAKFIRSLK